MFHVPLLTSALYARTIEHMSEWYDTEMAFRKAYRNLVNAQNKPGHPAHLLHNLRVTLVKAATAYAAIHGTSDLTNGEIGTVDAAEKAVRAWTQQKPRQSRRTAGI